MTTIRAFIRRHSVPTYFALTFAISWGGIFLVIGGPAAIPSPTKQVMMLLPGAIAMMLVGPSVAGVLLTGVVHGKAGLRDLVSRSIKWRVGARWYVAALAATPLLVAATLFALLPTSPVFLPGILASGNKASLLLLGVAVGLGAGIFEEIGWTGFAIPELRLRHGVLTTGLIVGFLWGAWHYLVAFWGSGDPAGAFSLRLFLPQLLFYVGVLPVYRVLMVWVYDRTGSLLVAMLMHASLTGSVLFVFMPLAISGGSLLTWYLVLTATLWVLVAAITVANGRALSRQPIRRRAA